MVNPSALGVAFLVLLATTTMVGSSSPSRQSFQVAHPSLGTLPLEESVEAMLGAYQSQTNTISLDQDGLDRAQRLTVQVPRGVTFQGRLLINGEVSQSLQGDGITLDLRDFLSLGLTEITLEGTYTPPDSAIMIAFENPETTVRQQVGQQGLVRYHIQFRVD
ncbi:hypothetical protein GFS31_28270 [Leptolyngbya sp. BL0902]|uniref:hypothetical protein n=1 Tax=Leptolyngbya sp. BL0902 TaxID=1115757 RepID=UPI0018E89038|nr:hypothetical protein [Leptolyngbya sp. BL0902]QQE66129.1 hypothetical protein GFS31_28270 [Leptolyngbya sp. BL0902]